MQRQGKKHRSSISRRRIGNRSTQNVDGLVQPTEVAQSGRVLNIQL
nr:MULTISPECIES: hypothetical protein [unclassified Rhodococcus (in: high G+C Gram-positive bacteria)]